MLPFALVVNWSRSCCWWCWALLRINLNLRSSSVSSVSPDKGQTLAKYWISSWWSPIRKCRPRPWEYNHSARKLEKFGELDNYCKVLEILFNLFWIYLNNYTMWNLSTRLWNPSPNFGVNQLKRITEIILKIRPLNMWSPEQLPPPPLLEMSSYWDNCRFK